MPALVNCIRLFHRISNISSVAGLSGQVCKNKLALGHDAVLHIKERRCSDTERYHWTTWRSHVGISLAFMSIWSDHFQSSRFHRRHTIVSTLPRWQMFCSYCSDYHVLSLHDCTIIKVECHHLDTGTIKSFFIKLTLNFAFAAADKW